MLQIVLYGINKILSLDIQKNIGNALEGKLALLLQWIAKLE